MNRLEETIKNLKIKNQKALVGFITGGDPDRDTSVGIIKTMIEGGIDILELGVPFSDPTADGPVIQRSSVRALSNGMNLSGIFDIACQIRKTSKIPIIIFSYFNPILAFGVDRFFSKCREVGIDGYLVVDLPLEESAELKEYKQGNDIPMILLVAPTTDPVRMSAIAGNAGGFIYLISMTGVTGSDGIREEGVREIYRQLKPLNDIPVYVGFGISEPEQARRICAFADGVVVGSAFEKTVEENLGNEDLLEKIKNLTVSLKKATAVEN